MAFTLQYSAHKGVNYRQHNFEVFAMCMWTNIWYLFHILTLYKKTQLEVFTQPAASHSTA